jgi:uncharacterized repeat protein (TIGR01451 family)
MKKSFIITCILIFLRLGAYCQYIYINAVPHHSNCHAACDGSVAVAGNNGIAPYTYTWMPSGVNTSTLNNLCPGNYTVYVADAASTTASLVVTILEQPSNLLPIFSQNQTCQGACTGSITIYPGANGGSPPYTYAINNLTVNPGTIGNLCEGNYTVQVTDGTNCSSNYAFYLNPLPSMSYSTFVTYTNTACGTCNGSARVYPAGPVSSFNWQPGGMTTDTLNHLCVGSYSVNITDNYGCAFTKTINITNTGNPNPIPNLSLNTTAYKETCYLSGDGAIDLAVSGTNSGPFNYLWNTGATTQDITNISSGIYWVAISDANSNCILLKDTILSNGSNCGTISGNVFIDSYLNCYRMSNDTSLDNATIIVNPGNRIGYSNIQGDYTINNLPNGTYSISVQTNNWYYTPSCSPPLSVVINSTTPNSTNNNLAVISNTLTNSNPDMNVWAYSLGFVPGFVSRMNYFITNNTNINGSGLYKITLPTNIISSILNASPSTYTVSADTVIWTFNNIQQFDLHHYYIDFMTPSNTPLGSVFSTCMFAQTLIADYNYSNNNFCYSHIVTGSFDPNDKTVSPVGVGATGGIAATVTDLTYLIRFQNTGNGPAVNIVVKDTLSPNVDVNTFEMLGSSHNYNIEILPGNILKWKFNNIMLPDSNSNEPGSHGYIQYRIKRNNNNTPGTQIKNTAYIYFDFNEPVVTNTAINTIETVAGISSQPNSNDGWNVYPNPSTGVLYIVNSSSVKEASQVQVLNAIGQTVLEETITSNYKNMDLSKLTNGVYFVKITSDKSYTVKRVVLSK